MMKEMNGVNKLYTKEIAAHFGISRSTLSRWVARGCPYQKNANQYVFCINEVAEWIKKNKDPEISESLCLKSRRILKLYHVFSCSGDYQGEVLRSIKLIARLKTFDAFEHHHPYGVDETGQVYFIYSGKLRKHDSVKGMAGVRIRTRYPQNIQKLMQVVYEKYINGNFRLNKKSAGGISSPMHPQINFSQKLNKT
jgi:hypothetical protein